MSTFGSPYELFVMAAERGEFDDPKDQEAEEEVIGFAVAATKALVERGWTLPDAAEHCASLVPDGGPLVAGIQQVLSHLAAWAPDEPEGTNW